MSLFDPNLRGRYIKLGKQDGFVKLSKIARAVKGNDAQGSFVTIHRKGGEPSITLRGRNVDRIKRSLEREGIPEV